MTATPVDRRHKPRDGDSPLMQAVGWVLRSKVFSGLLGATTGTIVTAVVVRFFLVGRLLVHETDIRALQAADSAQRSVQVRLDASVNVLLKSACLDRTVDEQDMIGLIGCPLSMHRTDRKP